MLPISSTVQDANSSLMIVNYCVVPHGHNFLAFLSGAEATYQLLHAYLSRANNLLELYLTSPANFYFLWLYFLVESIDLEISKHGLGLRFSISSIKTNVQLLQQPFSN